MCCLVLPGCDKQRVATAIKPPPERLICEAAGERPTIPAEYQIDWQTVASAPTVPIAVERAKVEVGKLMATIRDREGVVAGYIVRIEGKLFVCSDNAAWMRDFYGKLPG